MKQPVPLHVRAAAELELRRRRALQQSEASQSYARVMASCLPWATELERQARYYALFGGRGGGKSQYFATRVVASMMANPDCRVVCIREVQHSLTYSAKLLIEQKISELGLDGHFRVMHNEIRRIGGKGFCIFKGMQDHNAENIKSLEGFDIAWVEEAQSISQRSLDLLDPTIRKESSQLWFSWNPEQPDDPVDAFFRKNPPPNAVVRHVGWEENELLSQALVTLQEQTKASDPDKWDWVWNGGYNLRSNVVVFAGRWRIAEVDTTGWDGPYYGGDFGFSADPTAAIRLWVAGDKVYADYESYAYGLEINAIAQRWIKDIPGIAQHVLRADSARPDTIRYLYTHGLPKIVGAPKGAGSVESGVEWLRSREIIVHPRCVNYQDELKRYRYKTNKSGDPLAQIEDKENHLHDSARYGLSPLIAAHRKPDMRQSVAHWG